MGGGRAGVRSGGGGNGVPGSLCHRIPVCPRHVPLPRWHQVQLCPPKMRECSHLGGRRRGAPPLVGGLLALRWDTLGCPGIQSHKMGLNPQLWGLRPSSTNTQRAQPGRPSGGAVGAVPALPIPSQPPPPPRSHSRPYKSWRRGPEPTLPCRPRPLRPLPGPARPSPSQRCWDAPRPPRHRRHHRPLRCRRCRTGGHLPGRSALRAADPRPPGLLASEPQVGPGGKTSPTGTSPKGDLLPPPLRVSVSAFPMATSQPGTFSTFPGGICLPHPPSSGNFNPPLQVGLLTTSPMGTSPNGDLLLPQGALVQPSPRGPTPMG